MNTLISILFFCFWGFLSDSSLLRIIKESEHHDGKCTGSAYCTACSNCSRCGHCSSGGTCGVCKGNFSAATLSSKRSSSKKSSPKGKSDPYDKSNNKGNSTKIPRSSIEDLSINLPSNNIIISNRTTSLFEKPSFKSKIIETIKKNTSLVKISKNSSWYKVKIQKSEKVGYINSNDIQ
ncbi:SH3 domain-containing protein [Chryseobacterium sp. G0186]|uniref:SH3 domain-containing protein n=1 Tax=Chryseobacterium sp. G0186 TaxID=2487064 RepID=UPI000F4FD3C9|nr:SH3 domain-containing protein [Chryseobacterium sp. G0186]